MSAVLAALLYNSLRGGVLILAVLVLRRLLRRLPKRSVCLLWTAVWLRLALPFSIRSQFSVLPRMGVLEGAPGNILSAPASAVIQAEAARAVSWNPVPLLSLVWAAGLLALLVYTLAHLLLLRRHVQEAIPLRGRIWLCDRVESPFLLGLLRPRIYLPAHVEAADIPWIAAHEEAHLRNGDAWRKAATFALTAVYWFQPLCWIAFYFYRQDLELACDERASRALDAEGRTAYARALARSAAAGRGVWALSPAFGASPVQRRIEALLRPKRCGRLALLLAAVISTVILLVLTVEPKRAEPTERENPLATIVAECGEAEAAGFWVMQLPGEGAAHLASAEQRQFLLLRSENESLPFRDVVIVSNAEKIYSVFLSRADEAAAFARDGRLRK